MFDAFAENDRILFLVLSGNNGCHCAVHLFRPYFTTSMVVWLPGSALATTALCWFPKRCWSYSQYSCYAARVFLYYRRYINFWILAFGILDGTGYSIWNPEFDLSFWEWSCVIMVRQYFTTRSLCSEDIDRVSDWKKWYRAVSSTEQGRCWLCLCEILLQRQFRIIREFQW